MSKYHKLDVFAKLGRLIDRRFKGRTLGVGGGKFNFLDRIRLDISELLPMDFTNKECPELSEEFWPIFG